MLMEEKMTKENILTKDHLDDIYTLFVNLCHPKRYGLIPKDFIDIFSLIAEKRNLNIDKEFWNQIFFIIDHDKDGRITFQDFLRYVYYNMRIVLGEVGDKMSFNKIQFGNIINPFNVVQACRKIQPVYADLALGLKSTGEIKIYDGEVKNELLKQCIEKLADSEIIEQIFSGVNSSNLTDVFNTIVNLNRTLKPYDLISSHYEISNFIPEIIFTIKNLVSSGIIDRLMLYLNYDYNLLNVKFITSLLKIFKRLINISIFIIDLHNFSKINDLNITKQYEADIINLKDYLESGLIEKIMPKFNILFDIDNTKIYNTAFNLAFQIGRKNITQMSLILNETNLLAALQNKFDYLISSNQFMFFNLIETFTAEIRKYTYYFILITQSISTIKDTYNTYTNTFSLTLNKMLRAAESLAPYFFSTNDQVLHYYYLILAGFLTRKTNFDDKVFLHNAQGVINENFSLLIRPFFFYVKNFLCNKIKGDPLPILTETKTIAYLYESVKNNYQDDYLVSEFLEIFEIILEEHKPTLLSSSLIREMIFTFTHFLNKNFYYNITRKVMFLIKNLSEIKEPLIESIFFEYDVVTLVFNNLSRFGVFDSFFMDHYCCGKKTYDLVFVGAGLEFLTTISSSSWFKSSPRLLKFFNMDNLIKLVNLFNHLYALNMTDLTYEGVTEEDSQIYEKYRDLAPVKLFKGIILLLDHIYTLSLETQKKIQVHSDYCKDPLNLDSVTLSLGNIIENLEEKYKQTNEDKDEEDLLPVFDPSMLEVLHIFTQNKSESEKNLYTDFKFANSNDLVFSLIATEIERHYKSDLHFYYMSDESDYKMRIKDHNDFLEILTNLVNEVRSLKRECLEMRLFVDDEQGKKTKIFMPCISCGRMFEMDNFPLGNETYVCETCKNLIVKEIVNKTSPYKNIGSITTYSQYTPMTKK